MLSVRLMRPVAPIAVAALFVAACQAAPAGDFEPTPDPTETPATPTPAPTEEPTEEPTETPDEVVADGPQLAVAEAAGIGDYVVDEDGFTLYIFLNDSPGVSNCVDQCAATWPPLTVEEGEEPGTGEEISADVGTTTRQDGSIQVTLDDWPLYYYAPDGEAGDTNGEGVGDVWFVARPDGSVPNGGSGGVDGY
jgi:predicted lipoprotein with Yx(FWY)xxD motif